MMESLVRAFFVGLATEVLMGVIAEVGLDLLIQQVHGNYFRVAEAIN